jgi:N6-adenosine-specific RNA methylase IME4
MARFSVILADPPWKYNNRANHKTRFRGGACGHYQLMTMPEIAALPIGDIAADDSALFMWCTFPYLDEQIRLFEHWGFKYRTAAFVWIKTNPGTREPFFGVGYYTKSNAEVCLLGVRGRMQPISNRISSVVISPRREHSRKPDEVRTRIVQLFGDVPRIELFARSSAPGWAAAGNGVDGADIRETLAELAALPAPVVATARPLQSAMEL